MTLQIFKEENETNLDFEMRKQLIEKLIEEGYDENAAFILANSGINKFYLGCSYNKEIEKFLV
jgi:hypothetical protein